MSKKFTLVTYRVQQGEYEYFEYFTFLTSDFQKMNDMQRIAYYFECDWTKKLDKLDKHTYWINGGERSAFVYGVQTVDLKDHELLEKFSIVNFKPNIIFKKESNVVQLKRKVG